MAKPMGTFPSMKRRSFIAALVLGSAVGVQACAAMGLTLFGVGAGVTAGTGVSYTMDGIAYKTFTTPVDTLQAATLDTLDRMDIEVRDIEVLVEQSAETGRKIIGTAGDRAIEIELDRLTTRTSRMRVVAKQGVFFKDRATAAEIIAQTEQTLEKEPARAATAR